MGVQVGNQVILVKFGKAGEYEAPGVVLAVVPPKTWPAAGVFLRYQKGRSYARRDVESYIVESGGKKYWPLTDRIRNPGGPAVPPAATLDTEFIICLDDSGSMASCSAGAVKALQDELKTIQETAGKFGMTPPRVTLWTFGNGIVKRVNRESVERMAARNIDYSATGPGTPLFDCACLAIDAALAERHGPSTSLVLHVITDGGDNASHSYGANGFKSRLAAILPTDVWSVAFMLPRGQKDSFCRQFGINAGNAIEWDNTEVGARVASGHTQSAVQSYMVNRSAGVRSVKSFYVQPDLSALKAGDLAKLTDLSSCFKVHTVTQEDKISDFVEGATGQAYRIGSGYYQLTKKEKVQRHKAVLLRDRFSKKIYGGIEARKLIGLPSNQDCKIEPGNHAQYDIFLESDSVNRLLPRGSMLLHDFGQKLDKQPTWDHTAAKVVA